VTGETEEVGALGRLQLESAGDACQDLGRNPDVPALLEPGVPGEADAGEVDDFSPAGSVDDPAMILTVLSVMGAIGSLITYLQQPLVGGRAR
jgi:hypothetical protein